jgi:hypothetical protein
LVRSRDHRTQFERGPSKNYATKVWLQLAQWFPRRRLLCEFHLGSYVKLSSAVGAILFGGMKCRTPFWKGTPKDHFSKVWLRLAQYFQRRFFCLISSTFFLFLGLRPSWFEIGITGHNFGRGPCKDHSTKVWLQLIQWFLRRRFLCEFPIESYVKLSSAVGAI